MALHGGKLHTNTKVFGLRLEERVLGRFGLLRSAEGGGSGLLAGLGLRLVIEAIHHGKHGNRIKRTSSAH